MDSTIEQWQIPEGTDVVGADGDKVGKVVAAESSYIVVEKGFFFPTDYYIPVSAVSNYDGDKVYLNVTKDEALNQGWDQQLGDSDVVVDSAPLTESTYVQDAAVTGEGDRLAGVTPTGLADTVDAGATDTTLRDPGSYAADRGVTTTDVSEGDTLRVPVHEEELTATTRPVERGQVKIDKTVVAEDRSIDVPITEDKVTITRRAVDRDAGANDTAFTEDSIEIPLRSEEVDVQKRVRVAEEIEVAKQQVQRTEHVSDTVRREQVNVDDSSVDRSGSVSGR